MLADVYLEAQQWEKAFGLFDQATRPKDRNVSAAQLSYGYFKRGRSHYARDDGRFDPTAAFADYANSVRTSPKSPWADEAMFKAANILWNHRRDADGAIALWRRLIRATPTSDEASRAAYFVGVIYEWSERPNEAAAAYEYFLRAYPGSRFAPAARLNKHELEKEADMSAVGREDIVPRAAN